MNIDTTYDIRASAPDLAGGADDEALPPARSREQYRTGAIRNRLAAWVREQALPTVEAGPARDGHTAVVRSTGEPREPRTIGCDAAGFPPNPSFPEACPAGIPAERTFRARATSMHVLRLRQRGRGDRPSKHRHDVIRPDDVGIADKAFSDHAPALAGARRKAMFFGEKDAVGARADYGAAVSDKLRPVPTGPAINALAEDYTGMPANGLLPNNGGPFEAPIERCADIGARADRPRPGDGSVD